MKRSPFIIAVSVVACFAFLVSCGPNKQKLQDNLAKEVIAVHDEVMPKMGELTKLRRELKDSVNHWTADSTVNHSVQIQKATDLIADLDAADKGMMDWMHEYNGGQGIYDHEEIMKYLNEEMVKITAVKEQMNGAIEASKIYLKK